MNEFFQSGTQYFVLLTRCVGMVPSNARDRETVPTKDNSMTELTIFEC